MLVKFFKWKFPKLRSNYYRRYAMLILMESCPYFVFKSFCFSMFSVYLNWIDNGIQADTVLEYLQQFSIFSSLILIMMIFYYQNEGSLVNRSYLTCYLTAPPVVSGLNLRKSDHKMCFTKSSPGPHSPAAVGLVRSEMDRDKDKYIRSLGTGVTWQWGTWHCDTLRDNIVTYLIDKRSTSDHRQRDN